MRTHTEGLLNQFPTVAACLCGEARIDSDHSMSSVLSFGFKDVEERAPTGVHDGFRQMMIFHHPIDVEVLNSNMVILLGVLFGHFEVEITALPLDLQMGLRRTTCGLLAPFRAFLASAQLALLASEGLLALAKELRVFHGSAFGVGQKDFQSHIDADIGVRTSSGSMFSLRLRLADNERVPVSIRPMHQMTGLRYSFKWTMEFDLEGGTNLLGDGQMLPIRGKREVRLVLPQLDRVPAIGGFEAREPALLTKFFHSKEAFERFIQAICEHLNGRSRHMGSASSFEASRQIVLQQELAVLFIVLLGGSQHLVIHMPRLDEAGHEQAGLFLVWIQAVFKRSHDLHFSAGALNRPAGKDAPNKERAFYPQA